MILKQHIWLFILLFLSIFQADCTDVICFQTSAFQERSHTQGEGEFCCCFIIIDFFFNLPLFITSIYFHFFRWKLDFSKFISFYFLPYCQDFTLVQLAISFNCYPFKAVLFFFHDLPKVFLLHQSPWQKLETIHPHLFYPPALSFFFLLAPFLACMVSFLFIRNLVNHLSPQLFLSL